MSTNLSNLFGAQRQIQLWRISSRTPCASPRRPAGRPRVRRRKLAGLPDSDKRDIVRQIAEDTEAPSDIHRHFESYPHPFSKKLYARYLGALKNYKMSLGL